ncbi:hypothetical protein [Mesonia sp. K7]|uniref:hypothetical protein n=1 Tax=Mesonia sp. K7 TaxID=2218606 RepID=UPI000DA9B4DC|nr:hypothetical protein [Mesonia sp. K7]PZD77582.1 hypothetical protein DNG35_08350 [Mesonia sp. K7]
MKSIFNLTLLIIFSLYSCEKQDHKAEKIAKYFNSHIHKDNLVAELDFSLSDSLLFVNDIEEKIKVDLCKSPTLTGKFHLKNTEFKLPIFVLKNCQKDYDIDTGVIHINIIENDSVIIFSKKISNDIKNEIVRETKELINGKDRKSLVYLITWKNGLDSVQIKQRFYEILEGIYEYADEQSLKIYKKHISELSSKELLELNEEFVGHLSFIDYFEPVPIPPPPPPEKH